MTTSQQFDVHEINEGYWRVTFTNGDINLMDMNTVDELAELVTRIENAPELKVVAFDSSNPDYFIAHWDVLGDIDRILAAADGPTGMHPYIDNFVRLSRVPAVTISAIRGRVRGAGNEFALSTDIRFAGHKAILGQFEVGVGIVPGGGAMARLSRLVGRARTIEIVLGADDIGADLAERYGYINRAVPDAELDAFVDAFARRIAGFDKPAIAEAKALIDDVTLPENNEFLAGFQAYFTSSSRERSAARIKTLLERGLQQPGDLELNIGARITDFQD